MSLRDISASLSYMYEAGLVPSLSHNLGRLCLGLPRELWGGLLCGVCGGGPKRSCPPSNPPHPASSRRSCSPPGNSSTRKVELLDMEQCLVPVLPGPPDNEGKHSVTWWLPWEEKLSGAEQAAAPHSCAAWASDSPGKNSMPGSFPGRGSHWTQSRVSFSCSLSSILLPWLTAGTR